MDLRLVAAILTPVCITLGLVLKLNWQLSRMSFQHDLMWSDYLMRYKITPSAQDKGLAAHAGD